jgi:hypothetical protein
MKFEKIALEKRYIKFLTRKKCCRKFASKKCGKKMRQKEVLQSFRERNNVPKESLVQTKQNEKDQGSKAKRTEKRCALKAFFELIYLPSLWSGLILNLFTVF